MAFGLTGINAYNLPAASNTTIYTCPYGKVATVNVRLVNRNTSSNIIRLAVVEAGGTLSDKNYIEYDMNLAPSAVLENVSIVLSSGDFIVAKASLAGVSAVVLGFEENI